MSFEAPIYDPRIDYFSNVYVLEARLPKGRLQMYMNEVKETREILEHTKRVRPWGESTGFNANGGHWFHACKMPAAIVGMINQIDPEFFKDERKIHTWIRRHPEWTTGRILHRTL